MNAPPATFRDSHAQPSPDPGRSRANAAGGGLHIYVLVDALGWTLVQRSGFLEALLPYRRPLRTILGFSSGAIPTILTGETPARHGHWNLLYLDPDGSPFRWLRRLDFLPAKLFDHRLGRYALTQLGRRWMGLGPSFECCVAPALLPWFNWVEKKHLYQAGSVEGMRTVFDHWSAAGLAHRIYSYREGDDDQLLRAARRDLEQGEVSTQFIYLSQLDHFLHLHRNEPAAIALQLQHYASKLRELHAVAYERDSGLRFLVFSDHGMAPVRSRLDLARAIRDRGWKMPKDYLAVYDSTMVRCWFFNPRAAVDLRNFMGLLNCGRILDDEELRRAGVWFADRRFGELIFLLNPGVMVAQGDFNGAGWNPSGMHGYHPDDPDSDAAVMGNDPEILQLEDIRHLYKRLCEPLRARMVA